MPTFILVTEESQSRLIDYTHVADVNLSSEMEEFDEFLRSKWSQSEHISAEPITPDERDGRLIDQFNASSQLLEKLLAAGYQRLANSFFRPGEKPFEKHLGFSFVAALEDLEDKGGFK